MPGCRRRIYLSVKLEVNTVKKTIRAKLRPIVYWQLWLVDVVLVSAGVWFYLATQYGTYEFFGKAIAMAVLPFIPVMVLVGGAGSTIFALTKVMIEKRSVNFFKAVVLLVGPGMVVTLVLVALGVWQSPKHRLSYVCHGQVPAGVSQVQVTGYSAFLRAQWLAVFTVDTNSFQKWIAQSKLKKTPAYDFDQSLKKLSLKDSRLYQQATQLDDPVCFRRVFNESEEHERGRIYAAFDAASSTAVVLREYHD